MGWWGHGIMEGDTPCDTECILFDLVGIKVDEDTGEKILPPNFKCEIAVQLPYTQRIIRQLLEDHVVYTAVTHTLISLQQPLCPKLRELTLQAIKQLRIDANDFRDPDQRIKYLDHFEKQVRQYPTLGGQSNLAPSRGLFEMLLIGNAPGTNVDFWNASNETVDD